MIVDHSYYEISSNLMESREYWSIINSNVGSSNNFSFKEAKLKECEEMILSTTSNHFDTQVYKLLRTW